jgi:ribosome-associated translation inhibitor RaiA
MSLPVDITFRGMDSSDFVAGNIREHADKLSQVVSDLQSCRVVVEAPSQHHNHGQPFHVRVEIRVAGEDIVVDREPGRPLQAHEDVYVAIHDAFHTARRRLEERVRRRREERRREGGTGEGNGA